MQRALHDPQRGYYARRIKRVGTRGDFTTAPMLSEMPAKAIAAWAARAMAQTGCRDLIEIGPGEGKLAAAVMKNLPLHIRWKTRLHLIETSVPLTELQKNLLGKSACWHHSPAEALAQCGGKAVMFSNELVDAFPVQRFQKTAHGWCEMAVSFDLTGKTNESLMPPAPLPDSSGFLENHPLGQKIEIHDSYRRWLLDWLPLWKAGRILTIDYGTTADALYHRRPGGTVRGYWQHHRIEGLEIYQNIGHQDLTADVNFTDLMRWSARWTTDTQLTDLHSFLNTQRLTISPVDLQLTDSDGAGGAFLVLDQKCGG